MEDYRKQAADPQRPVDWRDLCAQQIVAARRDCGPLDGGRFLRGAVTYYRSRQGSAQSRTGVATPDPELCAAYRLRAASWSNYKMPYVPALPAGTSCVPREPCCATTNKRCDPISNGSAFAFTATPCVDAAAPAAGRFPRLSSNPEETLITPHDAPFPDSADAISASSPPEDLQTVCLRRLDDLQRTALTDPDHWRANLNSAGGGLLRMGMRLEEAFETVC